MEMRVEMRRDEFGWGGIIIFDEWVNVYSNSYAKYWAGLNT